MKLLIGSHVSFTKEEQLLGCIKETLSYAANACMFYTGAPQNTKRIKIDNNLTTKAISYMKENNIDINNVLVHAPYIINLANNTNEESYKFAINFLKQEISRCTQLHIKKIILHPGSHVGLGIDIGIENIVNALNKVITPSQSVIICLETMSGKGSECGKTFEELKKILDGVNISSKIGFCIDTCHLNDAGYDISNFDSVIREFDRIIGIDKLYAIHINDSKNEIGSMKDRHENLGFGNLGFNNILNVIYHPFLENIPKILETPYITSNDNDKNKTFPPYKAEIKMIKNKEFNNNLYNDIRNYYKR
ncbi:MAG: deoxyribonuclease IV [Bacilli bacterium]